MKNNAAFFELGLVTSFIALLCLTATPRKALAQGGGALAGAVVLKSAIGDIKKTLDDALVTADEGMKNRIHQVQLESESLLRQVDSMKDDSFKQANSSLDRFADKTFDLSQQARDIIGDLDAETSMMLNDKLIQVCRIVSALPLTNVRSFVAGIEPYNLSIPLSDRRIAIQGFFPLVDSQHPATVSIGGKTLTLLVSTRNRLVFDLPEVPLEKDKPIPFTLHIPMDKKLLGWRVKYQDQQDRLNVMNPTPFTFTITAAKANPSLHEEVKGTVPFSDEANTHNGHNLSHVAGVKSAWDIFSISVPNAGDYVEASVAFKEKPKVKFTGDTHCSRKIPWSGKFEGWDEHKIRYTLNAPSTGDHSDWIQEHRWLPGHPSYHDGGGSRATIVVKALFKATKKTTVSTSSLPPIVVAMGPTDVKEIPLTLGDVWKIGITANYGNKGWTQKLDLEPPVTSNSKPNWAVDYRPDLLTLTTKSRPSPGGH